MINLIDIYKEIKSENPDKTIGQIERVEDDVIITTIINNEYYELCRINVNTCEISVNDFLILYDDFIVDKEKIINVIKK